MFDSQWGCASCSALAPAVPAAYMYMHMFQFRKVLVAGVLAWVRPQSRYFPRIRRFRYVLPDLLALTGMIRYESKKVLRATRKIERAFGFPVISDIVI